MGNRLSFRSKQVLFRLPATSAGLASALAWRSVGRRGPTGPWLDTGARPGREAALGEWVGLRQSVGWAVRAERPTDGLRESGTLVGRGYTCRRWDKGTAHSEVRHARGTGAQGPWHGKVIGQDVDMNPRLGGESWS